MRLPLDLSNGGLAHAEISQFSARQPLFGRPNITETAKGDEFPTQELVNLDGAFYKAGVSGDTYTGGGHGSAIIGFDASLVSGVYGGSSTVQPSSVALLVCIKT